MCFFTNFLQRESALVQNRVHCMNVYSLCGVFFQGVQLRHNASEGIILTNRSLVLQSIDRKRSGGYVCQAVNGVGRGSSQPIVLDVKCKNTNAYFYMNYIASIHLKSSAQCFCIP